MPQVTPYPRMPIWDYWKPASLILGTEEPVVPEVTPMSLSLSEDEETTQIPPKEGTS